MADPRAEDADSYEQFEERIGRERASLLLAEASPRAGIPWAVAATALPLGFLFVLGAIASRGHAPLWEWVCGVLFSAVFVADVSLLVRHHLRRGRRLKEITRLEQEWQQRALRGEVPMTSGVHPLRSAQIRRHIEFLRSTGSEGPPAPQRSMRFLSASVVCIFLGVLTLFAGIAWSAVGAPGWVVWAMVVGMPGFALIGFLLAIVSRILSKRENQQLVARVNERVAAARRAAAR